MQYIIYKLVQTHKARWHWWRPVSWGSCQCPAFILANSYRKEQASPIWFCPKIPSSQCLSRGTEADAIRPLSGLISSADKCLIHGVSAVWRWLLIVHTTLCLQGQRSEPDTTSVSKHQTWFSVTPEPCGSVRGEGNEREVTLKNKSQEGLKDLIFHRLVVPWQARAEPSSQSSIEAEIT